MIVAIYKLTRAFDWWSWLCDGCRETLIAKGWQPRERKKAPHPLTCDDCKQTGETE